MNLAIIYNINIICQPLYTVLHIYEQCISYKVHGEWSTWGDWSSCTKTCGAGKKVRKRTCTNPPPSRNGDHCDGLLHKEEECNTDPCTSNISMFMFILLVFYSIFVMTLKVKASTLNENNIYSM